MTKAQENLKTKLEKYGIKFTLFFVERGTVYVEASSKKDARMLTQMFKIAGFTKVLSEQVDESSHMVSATN